MSSDGTSTSRPAASLAESPFPVPRRLSLSRIYLPTLFFLGPLAMSVAPRLTPFFIAIIGFSLIGTAVRRGGAWRELLPRQAALAACLLFGVYALVNASWSADPEAGLSKAALLIGLILVSFAAVEAAAKVHQDVARSALAFAVGAFLGALFILFELSTKALATRTAMEWLPLVKSPKHVTFTASGDIQALNLSKLDQNVNLALFHLWPGLLGVMALSHARRALMMALFFLAIAATIALSEHDSSQVALLGSSVILLLAWRWRRHVILALAVLWCAAFVLMIPASFVAYESGLHFAKWLPKSARARVIIWEYTAEQTLRHPLLGIGVDSTPRLSQQQKDAHTREQPAGFVFPRTMGHHAHSMFLQAWFELGAIGALLLAVAGAAVVLLIFLLPASAQPFAAATFAAFALVGAFAWGMWQSWFMCAIGLLPLYLRIVTAAVEARLAPVRPCPPAVIDGPTTQPDAAKNALA